MISCRSLCRLYGDLVAVQSLTLEIPSGKICALLGPNGAGKSTVVKMLAGLLTPTSGEARVAGIDVTAGSVVLKARIGVLPENLGLFDDLTVEEHFLLTGQVYGLDRDETLSRTQQLLRVLDLQDGRRTFAASCSHGMRKKTALAMALLPDPQVLLLDEPFEAIDPLASQTLQTVFSAAAQRGVTILMATHVLPAVERLADHVVIIRKGQIVWNASAAELPGPLEEHYASLMEASTPEGLPWLGSSQS